MFTAVSSVPEIVLVDMINHLLNEWELLKQIEQLELKQRDMREYVETMNNSVYPENKM